MVVEWVYENDSYVVINFVLYDNVTKDVIDEVSNIIFNKVLPILPSVLNTCNVVRS